MYSNYSLFTSLTAVFAFLISATTCSAQQNSTTLMQLPQSQTPPKIDAEISSSEWQYAAVVDGLEQLDIQNAPRERTRAYISYDADNIYLAVICWMLPGQTIRSEITQRDATVFTDDCVEIFLAPGHGTSYRHLVGNSIGTQYDASGMVSAWNGQWQYAAKQTDFGWQCEMQIPFTDFGTSTPQPGDIWGFLLGRTVQNPDMQFSQWGSCKTTWHTPRNFGSIVFQDDPSIIEITRDSQLRGLQTSIQMVAQAQQSHPQTIICDISLSQVLRSEEQALEQAVVMVFDAPAGLLIEQTQQTIELQPGQSLPIDLPQMPEQPGSYAYEVVVKNAESQTLFQQRIPIDRIETMNVAVARYPTSGRADITVDVTPSMRQKQITQLRATLKNAQGNTLWTTSQKGSDVYNFTIDQYVNLQPTTYQLILDALDRQDQTVITLTQDFKKAPPPPWLNNTLGIEPGRILEPWTPIELVDKNTVGIWARQYKFSPIGLPSQITAAEAKLLAASVKLISTLNSKTICFVPSDPLQVDYAPAATTITGRAHLDGHPEIQLTITTTVEYDGFAWTEITLCGNADAAIDSLLLEIPLTTAYARYHLPVFNDSPTITKEGLVGPAIPGNDWMLQKAFGLHWVGDEQRGLSWATETTQGWRPHDHDRAVELVPGPEQTLWRYHLADSTLALDQPVTFGFAWQATPVKPVPNWHSSRCIINTGYSAADPINDSSNAPSSIQANYDKGVRVQHFHEPWTEIMGYPGTFRYQNQLSRLMAEAHRVGMNIALYSHPVLSSIAPEFDEWINEFASTSPPAAAFKRTPPQQVYFCCKDSPWSDFYVYRWVQLVRQYGVNGIYLDGTFNAGGCTNAHHEHAYIKPDGTVETTRPIRANREFARRMYIALRNEDPDFFFYGHGYAPFTSQFLDYSFTGENFWVAPPNFELPLDYMRVVFSKQWGTPMTFYPGPIVAQPYAIPVCQLHDITVASHNGGGFEAFALPTYRTWEAFDVDSARFVGYWQPDSAVTCSHPDVKASYYIKPNNVLLAVATTRRQQPSATVTLDLETLGVNPRTLTVSTDTGISINVSEPVGSTLKLEFPQITRHGGRYIWLSSIPSN